MTYQYLLNGLPQANRYTAIIADFPPDRELEGEEGVEVVEAAGGGTQAAGFGAEVVVVGDEEAGEVGGVLAEEGELVEDIVVGAVVAFAAGVVDGEVLGAG